MLRTFLVMAVTGGSLLVSTFVLGLLASAEPLGPGAKLRAVHVLFAILTTMATLGVHSVVYTYFLATGKWAAEVVRVYGLPEWANQQAKANKKKAFRLEFRAMTWVAIAAWFGAGADAQGWNPLWHLGFALLAIVYNLYAFVAEYQLILTHARLLTEVKDQADRLREARYGQDAEALAATAKPEPH